MSQSNEEILKAIAEFRMKLAREGKLVSYFPSQRNSRIILAHVIGVGAPVTVENLMEAFNGLVTDDALFAPDSKPVSVEPKIVSPAAPEPAKTEDESIDALAGLGDLD